MRREQQKPNIGRDPTCGRLSFKTGVQKSRKNREFDRKDKYGRKFKEYLLKG